MATVKVLLRQSKLNDKGLAPLYLRIIKDRKAKFISLGIMLRPSEWNDDTSKVRKSHPNSGRLNAMIAQRVADAEGVAVEMETKTKSITSHRIKEKIMGVAPLDFIPYAEKHVKALEKTGRMSSFYSSGYGLSMLREYIGDKPLYFDEITVAFIKEYSEYLKTVKKNNQTTVNIRLKFIRQIINIAIREDLITHNDNPFHKITLKNDKKLREFLSEDELSKLENLELPTDSQIKLSRDMYIFAVYAGGLRISDVLLLRWANFDGIHIHLQMRKTKGVVTIKVPDKAIHIMNLYKHADSKPEHFVFPMFDHTIDYTNPSFLYHQISNADTRINRSLTKLATMIETTKKMSFHSSRHTFATRALRKGIRIEYVSKILGHADISQTQIYAKIVNEDLDRAMDTLNN